MFMRFFLLLIAIISVGPRANAEAGSFRSMHEALMSFVGRFPGSKAQCVAKAYSEGLGLSAYESRDSVRRSNFGVIENNKELMSRSPCFSTLVSDFYRDIPDLQAGRATLADSAGSESNAQHAPGWIWEKALKLTEGDKSLAMSIINVCLNDDVAYSAKIQVRADHADSTVTAKRLAFLNGSTEKTKEMLGWKLSDIDRAKYTKLLAKEEDELGQLRLAAGDPSKMVTSELNCPEPKSAAFLPGSLGADADLPADIKKPIAELVGSAPGRTPAKYYHVYSAAAMGCGLAKCGVTEGEAKLMQDKLSQAYRGFRLCTVVKDARELRKVLQTAAPEAFDDSAKRELLISKVQAADSTREYENLLGPSFCQSEGAHGFCIKGPLIDDPVQRGRYVRMLFNGMDSAKLFDDGKVFPGDSVPCSFAQYSGPKLEFNEEEKKPGLVDRLLGRDACRQSNWPAGRCNEALRTLRSWEADELWTRAQHQRGVIYGLKQCKGQSAAPLEDRACRLLGPAATPRPSSEGTTR